LFADIFLLSSGLRLQVREKGYRSLQIRKSGLAALESTAVQLSVSALAIFHSLTPFQLSGMYAGLFSS